MIPERIYPRVMDHADPMPTGCLVSRYRPGNHGYAQVGWSDNYEHNVVLCHRVVWEHHNGPVPSGMVIDHTCHDRTCIEITHLRLLSNFENGRRTRGRDWPLGQCINGHPNEYLHRAPNGRIRCKLCKADYQRQYRARKSGATMQVGKQKNNPAGQDERNRTGRAQNAAYNAAWARIRDAHREEYDEAVDQEFAKRGLTRRRRMSAEERAEKEQKERLERARAQLERILADNPELRGQLGDDPPESPS